MSTQNRAEVVVDLDAIAANTAALRERVDRPLMAVVKADGYGHGLVPAARAALAGGADALGVTVLEEALALRAAGVTAPVLSWQHVPGADYAAGIAADVELSVNAGGRWPRSSTPPAPPAARPPSSCSWTPACPGRAPPASSGPRWSRPRCARRPTATSA